MSLMFFSFFNPIFLFIPLPPCVTRILEDALYESLQELQVKEATEMEALNQLLEAIMLEKADFAAEQEAFQRFCEKSE